jgi:hypothetical protein
MNIIAICYFFYGRFLPHKIYILKKHRLKSMLQFFCIFAKSKSMKLWDIATLKK